MGEEVKTLKLPPDDTRKADALIQGYLDDGWTLLSVSGNIATLTREKKDEPQLLLEG